MRTPTSSSGDSLDRESLWHELDLWVRDGLITKAEARAIRAFETSPEAGTEALVGQAAAHAAPAPRVPLVAEVLGYVGAAAVVAATSGLIGQAYPHFSRVERLTLPGALAVVLFLAGLMLHRNAETAVQRLAGVLWLLSVGAVAGFVAVALFDGVENPLLAGLLIVGISASVYAAALYVAFRRAGPMLGLALALMLTAFGLGRLVSGQLTLDHVAFTTIGVYALALGSVWVLAGSRGLLAPRDAAVVVGTLIVLYGPIGVANANVGAGQLLGIAAAAAVLGASVWLRSTPMLVLGALGLYGYLNAAVNHFFGSAIGAPAVMLLAGVLLIGLALVVARMRRFTESPRTSR